MLTDWKMVSRRSVGCVAARFLFLGFMFSSLAAVPDARAGDERSDIGPAVGTALGGMLTLADQNGATRDFASLTGQRGQILVFNRSLSWCPFCIADAREWSMLAESTKAKAVNIAIVTYDEVDTLAGFAKRFDTRIALLSDKGSALIKALGILNEEHAPGSFAHGVPHPMVFVIDAKGVLRARFSETNYSHRPDKRKVLSEALALGGS